MPGIFSKLPAFLQSNEDSIFQILTSVLTLKTLAIIFALYILTSHYSKMVPRKNEPKIQSTWLPFFGHALRMGKEPIEMINEFARKAYETANEYIFGMLLLGTPFSTLIFLSPSLSLG